MKQKRPIGHLLSAEELASIRRTLPEHIPVLNLLCTLADRDGRIERIVSMLDEYEQHPERTCEGTLLGAIRIACGKS